MWLTKPDVTLHWATRLSGNIKQELHWRGERICFLEQKLKSSNSISCPLSPQNDK